MSPRQLATAELLEREQRILSAAYEVMAEVGVSALTLERVSQNLPYSKGTLYNHFTCKEDLIIAMCVESIEIFEGFKGRVMAFDASSRARMQALSLAYLLYAKLYPLRFMLVISAKSGQILEKASESRRNQLLDTESRLMALPVYHLIVPALESGECKPPMPLAPEQIIYSCWSNAFGAIALLEDDVRCCSIRQDMHAEREVLISINLVLDGLGWQPLSADHDWRGEAKRAIETLFGEELKRLKQLKTPFSVDF